MNDTVDDFRPLKHWNHKGFMFVSFQISPEVYSDYTRQQGFHISFLERLYDLYPPACSCMVMLCENYRSHKAIVDFTSELFYDQKLISSGKQTPHPVFYPLSFCHAKGLEIQHENSTGFYNMSEVSWAKWRLLAQSLLTTLLATITAGMVHLSLLIQLDQIRLPIRL
jgi:hypothetical protein